MPHDDLSWRARDAAIEDGIRRARAAHERSQRDYRRARNGLLACALLLALLCALAALGEDLVVGGTGAVGRDVGPEIYPCDPRCAYRGSSTTLPDPWRAGCYQREAATWLADGLAASRVIVTPWAGPAAAERVRGNHPQVRYGACPLWVEGAIGPDPYTGCAAGVAWGPSIYVSLGEPARVYPLHAWETTNAHLAWSLNRPDLGDGQITADATTHATTTCGTTPRRALATP